MQVTDVNFEKEVNTTDKYVLVDFFATWCGPCQVLGPILEKIAKKFEDKVVLMKVNVDEAPIASQKFGVERIPMVVLLKNGKQINSFVGLVPEQSIISWLENNIK
jgi:thioredoxin 1